MRGLKFDEDFNLVFIDGNAQLIEGEEHTLQKFRGRLLTRLGTLFFNTEIGLDFNLATSATIKNPTNDQIREAIILVAGQDPTITEINSVVITRNVSERNANVAFSFMTTGEEVTGEVVI